jgi:hypothetical protein
MSQDPDTKDYIMISESEYSVKCTHMYTDIQHVWCKLCQISYLRENFTNWTSRDKNIDNFIREMQLKIDDYYDTIFEWIPYNRLNDIKKSNHNYCSSAIWKDGPLHYSHNEKKYTRDSDKKVLLFYLGRKYRNVLNLINEV